MHHNPRRHAWLLLAGLLAGFLGSACASNEAARQPTPLGASVVCGVVRTLPSAALGEDRTLNVALPPSYASGDANYPVIYLLDGAAHEDFLHIAGLLQFFHMYKLMPESILVGIANVDRQRDFTHHTSNVELLEAVPTGGGSAAFMDFLQEELQPFIDAEYRTNGDDMLIGQSLGGLLATEVLLHRPALFEKYLIVSPSLWWDDSSMINNAGSFAADHPNLKQQVFLSIGTEPEVMHEGLAILRDLLENCTGGLRCEFLRFPDESHATVHHRAVYAGLESFYAEDYPGL